MTQIRIRWKAWLFLVFYPSFLFGIENQNSINLIWINNTLKEDRFIVPDSRAQTYFKKILEWASLNPSSEINVWYDARRVSEGSVSETLLALAEESELAGKNWIVDNSSGTMLISEGEGVYTVYKTPSKKRVGPVRLRNIWELAKTSECDFFDCDDVPVYFRVDMIRVLATLTDSFKKDTRYTVFTDWDMKAIPLSDLIESKEKDLQKYGFLVAKGGHLGFENGFHIFSIYHREAREALDFALLRFNNERFRELFQRSLFSRSKPKQAMRVLEQAVYNSYLNMFYYLHHLLGDGKISFTKPGFASRAYSKEDPYLDGHKVFGVRDSTGLSEGYSYEGNRYIPTVQVPLPPSHF